MHRILVGLFCVAVASVAIAEEKTPLPKTAPPTFLFISEIDKDRFLVEVREMVPVTREIEVKVEKNGRIVLEKRAVTEYMTVARMVAYPLKDAKILDAEGKELKKEDAWKTLKPGMAVLVTTDKNGVDPAYLKLLSRDALILVMPPKTGVAPPVVPVPPAPPVKPIPGEKSGE